VRVVAGQFGGRSLRAPRGHRTRPTSERVREALFSSIGADVEDAVVLDLFAGSGALGIEALSRGAARAVFVEAERRAAKVVQENLAEFGLGPRSRLVPGTAARFCGDPQGEGPFTLVLLDPPYAEPLAKLWPLLVTLRARRALAPGALVVLERDRHTAASEGGADPRPEATGHVPRFLAPLRERTYGDTVVRYLRVREEPGA
jgi:16S rRNA (guanine966-N2)-methyltransferase